MVKMALKMVGNHENYTKIFNFLPKISTSYGKWPAFGISASVKNVPNYSVFYFRDRQYIFPKLLKNPKLLPKRMALVQTKLNIVPKYLL